jgi:hypothetical protein
MMEGENMRIARVSSEISRETDRLLAEVADQLQAGGAFDPNFL